jgi:hypothetical protein
MVSTIKVIIFLIGIALVLGVLYFVNQDRVRGGEKPFS